MSWRIKSAMTKMLSAYPQNRKGVYQNNFITIFLGTDFTDLHG